MCGLLFWGVSWIFPLVGFLICLGLMTFRFLPAGRGFIGTGGHRATSNDQAAGSHH
jgi:hypothetical protein